MHQALLLIHFSLHPLATPIQLNALYDPLLGLGNQASCSSEGASWHELYRTSSSSAVLTVSRQVRVTGVCGYEQHT